MVPVHPLNSTTFEFTLTNDGNGPIGYDLFLESPTGWSAGFDNLGSEPGASSGSTGLMDQHAARAINVTVVPPSVKTVAGAERTVTLIAISQTDPAVSTSLDIPMQVMSIRDVGITLDSSLPPCDPMRRWAFSSALKIEATWTSTSRRASNCLQDGASRMPLNRSALVGRTPSTWCTPWWVMEAANQERLRCASAMLRAFTWTSPLEVKQLPDPTLDFNRLLLEDGSEYDALRIGSHPTGETLRFEWLVGNAGDASWTPSVQLDLDPGCLGHAKHRVTYQGEFRIVGCDVVLPPSLAANTEPSFSIVLSGRASSGVMR